MVSEANLLQQMQEMCIEVKDDALAKCIALCITYNLNEEDLVDELVAYKASKHIDSPLITLDNLAVFERTFLAKSKENTRSSKKSSNVKIYQVSHNTNHDLESYASVEITPKRNKSGKRQITPEEEIPKRRPSVSRALNNTFSSISFSPEVAKHSTKYIERVDSGNVVSSYGECDLISKATWTGNIEPTDIVISQYGNKKYHMPENQRYQYETLLDKAEVESNHAEWLASIIIKKNNLNAPESFNSTILTPSTVYGRICCDSSTRLDSNSVLLESTMKSNSRGKRIPIDLRYTQQYCLYPGQVIVAEATNPNGKTLLPNQIYHEANAPFPKEQPNIELSLQVVVACGPYTQSDSLTYGPLQDLVTYLTQHKPDVAILIGPFVDVEHERIADGMLAETFDEFFERLIQGIMEPLKGSNVQVVVVSSHRDAHHHPVYPTPQYKLRKTYPNLHLVPDPCLLSVNGVVFGLTSVDVMMHLAKEEICVPMMADRMGRLASHILSQRSFYTLSPCNKEINVDHLMWEQYAVMEVTPHILILPSKLRNFIKNVKGCLVVNPETLGKGHVGGTFARMQIFANNKNTSFVDNIACQIIKI